MLWFLPILPHRRTSWTLTKLMEKKSYGNCPGMLRAILNESWNQHPTKQQLHGHLPPISKDIQIRQTRHAGYYWRSKDELRHPMDPFSWRCQFWPTSKNLPITALFRVWKSCWERWIIGTNGGRDSGLSVPAGRLDYDIYIYILD